MEAGAQTTVPVWVAVTLIGFVIGLVGVIYHRLIKRMEEVVHEMGCLRDHVDAAESENDFASFKAMDAERLIHWSGWRKSVDLQIAETRRMLDVVSDRVTRARERLNNLEELVHKRRNHRKRDDESDDRDG